MLVNASIQPGTFYLDTVRGLCGGTTFEFAAWVMNVLLPSACSGNGTMPDLTFQIERTDGAVLQTYNSGGISTSSSPTWRQYGFFFATPVGVSDIVLRITNNAPGGCGNDLALDDITFRPCGPQLTPAIAGQGSDTAQLCEGSTQSYTFNCSISAGYTNPSFQWQNLLNGIWTDIPGANSNSLSIGISPFTAVGVYQYRLTASESGNINVVKCRVASAPLTVIVNANPVTTVSNNGPACERGSVTLNASGGTQYIWSNANGYSANGQSVIINNVQLADGGKYYVDVSNAAGCRHRDSTILTIHPSPTASVAFSNINLCEGDTVLLQAMGGGDYLWAPSNNLSFANIPGPRAFPDVTTQYSVIVSNQFLCADTAFVDVNVSKRPHADAGPDKSILAGQSLQLSSSASGTNISIVWSPGIFINDVNAEKPIVDPPADQQYALTVSSNDGCGVAYDTVMIKVYKKVGIPTVFSPNGDGINDTWNIPALDAVSSFDLVVFDRLGNSVFHAIQNPIRWDGTYKGRQLPPGTYVYALTTISPSMRFTGYVVILR